MVSCREPVYIDSWRQSYIRGGATHGSQERPKGIDCAARVPPPLNRRLVFDSAVMGTLFSGLVVTLVSVKSGAFTLLALGFS